jgi:DNA-binding IclR family transcriptional regulator
MANEFTKANAVEKALKILLELASHEHALGTGELRDELGFSPPMVSRLLQVLLKHEFVCKNEPGRK